VNRVWQWIFGTGLVATPDDFGRLGDKPSNPESLDWLAREFMREGWSTKNPRAPSRTSARPSASLAS